MSLGGGYPASARTGVRDHIHAINIAEGHLSALACLERNASMLTLSLGAAQGHSVLEMVRFIEKASVRKIPYTIAPRRSGDVAACWAEPAPCACIARLERFSGYRRNVRRHLALASDQ
jgi:UDP-glucose 4-epimerase